MKKTLKTEFSNRQYMLSRDFEIYYYSDRQIPIVRAHTHDYYEFYFFISGNIVMNIAGESFVPSPGSMMIIPPSKPHYATLIDGSIPYRRFVFWVAKDFLKSLSDISTDYLYLTSISDRSGNYFMHKFSDIEFNTIQGKAFSLIDEIHSDRFGKDAKILVSVSDFMLSINRMVYEAKEIAPATPEPDTLYQSIIQYIETHIDEDLSLDKLADKLHVSKFHISHLFKDTNGLPLHKYVTKKRLAMCKDAILGGQDISAVAETYGFSDYSVFYRAFIKEYGLSPKKYRDEIIRNSQVKD
ncbi:helix-turn-helix transcriptional regulator [Butyrivibrio sp. VCD2006]|uniref:helix-turn-helix transcriptional regulator n=1 Tax=Butyrivibrio sp. VCD2006 TaxID=1280664 RepID=UPI000429AF06|nr:AraC family transcriptional regulator [Butyrivibrio sp. VCD2006]